MIGLPLPDVEFPPTREFFAAAARGELRIPRCETCRRWQWYPEERCGGCGSERLTWALASGRGTLFSWAVVHRPLFKEIAPIVPYVTALVALAEDPAVRLATRIVDCDPAALRVDMPVRAVFRPLGYPNGPWPTVVPLFTPAA